MLDIATGKDLALMETAAEFVQRFRADHPKQHSGAPPYPILTVTAFDCQFRIGKVD